MDRPLPPGSLIARAFEVYRRYPVLFLVLASGVIVPYQLILLAVTGTGPFSRMEAGLGMPYLVGLLDWVLIGPLVSALHVHAVADIRSDREPQIGDVARRGLRVLPVVVAAAIISGLGIALGFLALIVPGVILSFRWAVVAQTAAIEHEGWLPALRRSRELTAGHYMDIFIFLLCITLLVTVPVLIGQLAFGEHDTSAAAFLTGLVLTVVGASFGALATALLYFDLRLRLQAAAAGPGSATASISAGPTSLDRHEYSDSDRPQGWYVDPANPRKMRFWKAGDRPGWTATMRTPRKIRREWSEKAE
jgi:hypothetical protein